MRIRRGRVVAVQVTRLQLLRALVRLRLLAQPWVKRQVSALPVLPVEPPPMSAALLAVARPAARRRRSAVRPILLLMLVMLARPLVRRRPLVVRPIQLPIRIVAGVAVELVRRLRLWAELHSLRRPLCRLLPLLRVRVALRDRLAT